jgi:hypothetical protein
MSEKFYADAIEEYPVWKITTSGYSGEVPLDFSEAEFADWRRVEAEYDAWQEKIAQRFRALNPQAPGAGPAQPAQPV